jgi:hypothetical protein
LVMFQNWPLCIPRKWKHHTSWWWLSFELPFDMWCRMFPFYTLPSFWSIMVDPHHISSDSVSKKSHFHYDSGSIGLGRLSNGCACALLWAVLETILLKLYKCKSFLDDSMSRTVTDVWMMHNFIDSHSWLCRIMARTCSILSSAADEDRHPYCSSSVILTQPFLNMVNHSYKFCCCIAPFPYCAESLCWVSAPGTPSAPKNHIITRCYSMVHKESGVTMLTLIQHCNWLVKVQSISQSHREFVFLPTCKISIAANTTFQRNHCRNIPTHMHWHCIEISFISIQHNLILILSICIILILNFLHTSVLCDRSWYFTLLHCTMYYVWFQRKTMHYSVYITLTVYKLFRFWSMISVSIQHILFAVSIKN